MTKQNNKQKNKQNNKEKKQQNTNNNTNLLPFVSICTPTFNRRPFIPYIIKCFENQTYPKDKIEWIIVDDGTDKIKDLVSHIPQVKYFEYETKLTLGKKRNLCHQFASGEIIINMDDDDYYPSDRISHAVEMLNKNPDALCAGSSEMYIYFKHVRKMYKFGPYGPNHATAATFAFRKKLLDITGFQDDACVAEEKHFLKNYTIPFVQLDSMKSILVFSHEHNSFDKKKLLDNINKYVTISEKKPEDFIKEEDILQFFMNDIDPLLKEYEPGDPKYKPDVLKQIDQLTKQRENTIKEYQKKMELSQLGNVNTNTNTTHDLMNKINDMTVMIQELNMENTFLKEKVNYLESKLKQLVTTHIEERKNNIQIQKET